MKTWVVTFQIKGNASLEIEADTEDDAINRAAEAVTFNDVEDWDIVKTSGEAEENS